MAASLDGNDPVAAPAGSAMRSGWAAVIVLILLALAVAVGRLRTFNEPLERDITTYAVIAHEMLGGRSLYSDLWDHKPPGVHVAFAAAELIAGYGPSSIYLLNVSTVVLAMIGVYLAGRAISGSAGAGLWGATLYALMSFSPELQANQPNTEAFINLFTAWFLYIAIAHRHRAMPLHWALPAGAMAALATLFKHVAIVPIAGVLAVWMLAVVRQPRDLRPRIFAVVVMALTVIASWAAVALYFKSTGRWDDFYHAVFVYNRAYSGDWHDTLSSLVAPKNVLLLGLCTVQALVTLARRRADASDSKHDDGVLSAMMLALSVGVLIAIALPRFQSDHYQQLWMPALALGMAWMVDRVLSMNTASTSHWRAHVAAGALLLPLTIQTARNLTLNADQWSNRKYKTHFIEVYELARRLRPALAPGDVYYDLGSNSGFYYAMEQSPPTGVFYWFPLKSNDFPFPFGPISPEPMRSQLTARVMSDLERRPPDMITVVGWDLRNMTQRGPSAEHPLVKMVRTNYTVVGSASTTKFAVLVRNDSDLKRRLNATPLAPTPTSNESNPPSAPENP